VNIFLDTSTLLSACGSAGGASRELFRRAAVNGWVLMATPYVLEEVLRNLPNLHSAAAIDWQVLRGQVNVMPDVFTVDRPVVFEPSKDRPILFSALAWADVLVTLDQADFGGLMDKPFYGLRVVRPGIFLEAERSAGRLL
jgi:predicted nucleic acid-binding protein